MAEINLMEGIATDTKIIELISQVQNLITTSADNSADLIHALATVLAEMKATQPAINSRNIMLVDTSFATTQTQVTEYRNSTNGATIPAIVTGHYHLHAQDYPMYDLITIS